METALIYRTVAEERQCDTLLALILYGKPQPGGDQQLGPDDRLAADHVVRVAVHVHRAALALAAAGGLAKQLGHHGLRLDPPEDGMPVLAVAADDVVLWLQCRERANPCRLLPDVEMEEAADLAECIFLGRLLLETPDE